ncbi:MAG: IclR family transcriptional regulator [Deltaproteobacteria bacterium]|nr:IclR family transcriptional regulator [Deltaproteobacteria bacterium]
MTTKTDNSFGSLEKAIRILSLFDSETPEVSAQEISERLNTPLSTTYNYLKVFVRNEILTKDPHTSKFRLGLKLFKLGILASENISLLEIARPYLESIAGRCQETVALTVIDGLEVLCVDTIESSRPVRYIIKRGGKLPLHAGAPGKALLAFTDRVSLRDVLEREGPAKADEDASRRTEALTRELASIRSKGYSESHSEVVPGFTALAVPIRDHTGRAIASLSIIGFAQSLEKEDQQPLIHMLKEAATEISAKLGYSRKGC